MGRDSRRLSQIVSFSGYLSGSCFELTKLSDLSVAVRDEVNELFARLAEDIIKFEYTYLFQFCRHFSGILLLPCIISPPLTIVLPSQKFWRGQILPLYAAHMTSLGIVSPQHQPFITPGKSGFILKSH